jgi:hypothetical protein
MQGAVEGLPMRGLILEPYRCGVADCPRSACAVAGDCADPADMPAASPAAAPGSGVSANAFAAAVVVYAVLILCIVVLA